MITQIRNAFIKHWKEKDFKRYFFGTLFIYILALLIDVLLGIPIIGFSGGIVTIIIMILIGKLFYKERHTILVNNIKPFWIFVIIYLIYTFFGRELLFSFLSYEVIFPLAFALHLLFWITFFLFWVSKQDLSTKSFSYITAVSLYSILFSIFALYIYGMGLLT